MLTLVLFIIDYLSVIGYIYTTKDSYPRFGVIAQLVGWVPAFYITKYNSTHRIQHTI